MCKLYKNRDSAAILMIVFLFSIRTFLNLTQTWPVMTWNVCKWINCQIKMWNIYFNSTKYTKIEIQQQILNLN